MATTDREQTAVAPKDCTLGSLVWDTKRDVPGQVMGHEGGDRVQLRALNGGREWDAREVRPLTSREELRFHNMAREAARQQS